MARASRASSSSTAALAIGLIFMTLVAQSYGQLKVGFYNGKCRTNNVEKVIFNIIKEAFAKDNTIVAALLLLHFHDCFVRGCDASILLDGSNTEKTAGPNIIVRGYDLIDAIKAGGGWYDIESGRKDGVISQASEAIANLQGALLDFGTSNLDMSQMMMLFGIYNQVENELGSVGDMVSTVVGIGQQNVVPITNSIITRLAKHINFSLEFGSAMRSVKNLSNGKA